MAPERSRPEFAFVLNKQPPEGLPLQPVDSPERPFGEKHLGEIAQMMARDFFEVVSKRHERTGRIRDREAAWQNRLTRAVIRGDIPFVDQFAQTMYPQIEHWMKQASGPRGSDINQTTSQEFYFMMNGVRHAVNEYKSLRLAFRQANQDPNLHQVIGMHDQLDAIHKTDFVDLRYRETPNGSHIEDIRLVQIKKGHLDETGQAQVRSAHRQFVESLMEPDRFKPFARMAEAKDRVQSGRWFQETYPELRNSGERLEALLTHLESFFLEQFTTETPAKSTFAELVSRYEQAAVRHGIPAVVLKLLFLPPTSYALDKENLGLELVEEFADEVGEPTRAKSIYEPLVRWASTLLPTSKELEPFIDKERMRSRILPASRFTSVVRHAGGELVTPLTLPKGAEKVLTRKAA